MRDATGLSYLATDHLGTPIATVNLDTGVLLGEQLRAPYGEARYAVSANNPSGGMHTTFGFTGQREDAASSGLDYFNARYYDAAVGRFISADSLVGSDSAYDGYAYVAGMVASASDPSGREVYNDPVSGLGNDGSLPPAGAAGTGVAIILGTAVVVSAAIAGWWDECHVSPSACGNSSGGMGYTPTGLVSPFIVVTPTAEIIMLLDSGQIQVITTSKRGTSLVSYLPTDPQYITYLTIVDHAYAPLEAGNQYHTHVHVNVPTVSEVFSEQVFTAKKAQPTWQGIPAQGALPGSDVPAGTPPVDAGQTGKHVKGHPNYVPGRGTWAGDVDIVEETIRAWREGQPVPGQERCVSAPAGRVIGTNGETWVKVHQKANGRIHGVPTSRDDTGGDVC